MNYDSEKVYDDDGNGPYDRRYPGRKVAADKGIVRVPLYMMDSAPGRADTRSEAVKLRDESYALMVDRLKNPRNYDPIDGRRLVNDGIVEGLTDDEVHALAKRLGPVMGVGVPENWTGSPKEADEDNGLERQDRDNRRPHFKPFRDRAEAIKLRDKAYAEMVDRMRNPKNYDMNGRRK